MNTAKKVPASRLARFGQLGALASKVAGNVLLDGASRLASGESLDKKSLLLTPKNVEQLTKQLSQMRGAAMKLGQLLSMDAGDLLPPELSQLLEKLRADAAPMPHKQLVQLLRQEWGEGWLDTLAHIELRPFGAASIGQVHQAYTEQSEKLAVKVQYPGVAKSIESDVDNVIMLLKLSGLLPKSLDISELITEAKQQLLNEADYLHEAQMLNRYRELLSHDDGFVVPKHYADYSSQQILAMEFVDGEAIDKLNQLPQAEANAIASNLIKLFFLELFEFKLIQTDPNLANYQYQPTSQRIVLLDFGATRAISDNISAGYKALFNAALTLDKQHIESAATQIGYFDHAVSRAYKDRVIDIFLTACEPLRTKGEYDFGNSDLAKQVAELGLSMSTEKELYSPPVDALFIHRKLAGLYLIAAKLNAKINVYKLYQAYSR